MIGQLVCPLLFIVMVAMAKPKVSGVEIDKEQSHVIKEPTIDQVQQHIYEVITNTELTWRQKNRQIDQIYGSLPPELFNQIPLNNEFNRLPKEILQKISMIHSNENAKLRERRERIRQILENLTYEQRIALQKEDFPLEPPSGFKEVLDADTYQKLIEVHLNPNITVSEKESQIDAIAAKVPKEIIDRLPLPEPMTQVPLEIQKDLRKIIFNFNLNWKDRFTQVRRYIRTLPKVYRRILRFGKVKKGNELHKLGFKFDHRISIDLVDQTTKSVPI